MAPAIASEDTMNDKDTRRFWSKVDKTGICWLWRGARNRQAYGMFHLQGEMRRAHRVAYELTYGAIPDGLFVCHTCDTPACVRPDHLWLGTARDNAQDCKAKGRLN